jgi:hypothetical protein
MQSWVQRPVLNNISLSPGAEIAPRGELCSRGECSPLCSPRGMNNPFSIGRRMKWQTVGLHPWGITSPLGYKVHPWGSNFALGAKLKTSLRHLPQHINCCLSRLYVRMYNVANGITLKSFLCRYFFKFLKNQLFFFWTIFYRKPFEKCIAFRIFCPYQSVQSHYTSSKLKQFNRYDFFPEQKNDLQMLSH